MPDKSHRSTANIDSAWKKSDLAGIEYAMQAYATDDDMVVSLRVENAHVHPITFTLEPWSEEVSLPPKASVWVFACGPKTSELHDRLHIECSDGQITVYGWSGCLAYMVTVEQK